MSDGYLQSGKFLDQSGNGNNAAIQGNLSTFQCDKDANVLGIEKIFFAKFGKSNARLSVPHNRTLEFGQTFTCQVWANGEGDHIVSRKDSFGFPAISSNSVSGFIVIGGKTVDFNFQSKKVNGWHHYALTYDGFGITVFVDSVQAYTKLVEETSTKGIMTKCSTPIQICPTEFTGQVAAIQLSAEATLNDQLSFSMMRMRGKSIPPDLLRHFYSSS
jgi:hypothetical protein